MQLRAHRLTNAFSKKLENHAAAVALYVMRTIIFCRVHETLRVTPAMQLGVTDHIWSIGELVDAALNNEAPKPVGHKCRAVPCYRRWPHLGYHFDHARIKMENNGILRLAAYES